MDATTNHTKSSHLQQLVATDYEPRGDHKPRLQQQNGYYNQLVAEKCLLKSNAAEEASLFHSTHSDDYNYTRASTSTHNNNHPSRQASRNGFLRYESHDEERYLKLKKKMSRNQQNLIESQKNLILTTSTMRRKPRSGSVKIKPRAMIVCSAGQLQASEDDQDFKSKPLTVSTISQFIC